MKSWMNVCLCGVAVVALCGAGPARTIRTASESSAISGLPQLPGSFAGPSLGQPAPVADPAYSQLPPAAEPPLHSQPVPAYSQPAPVVAQYGYIPVATPIAVPVHANVRVRDRHNIAPCAVPTLVQVPDPCDPCGERCVNVEVCVPPCDCPDKVRVTRNGHKVRYDYGKYAVDITVRKTGVIVVDYDD